MKYARILIDTHQEHDSSELSLKLKALTGHYADEFLPPAISVENVFNVISDESAFKGHFGVSVVVFPCNESEQTQPRESQLEDLCKEFNTDSIHFSEIFGRNSLGTRRASFLQKYLDIVGQHPLWAVGTSVERVSFEKEIPFQITSERELYFNLFWNVMEHVAEAVPVSSVFLIRFEQDNNRTRVLAMEYLSKLHDGILQCQSLTDRQISICRHPMMFSKKALLFSSLSDLAAYSNNYLQQKLDQGVPIAKLRKNHAELIEVARRVFPHILSLHQGKTAAADLILDRV